MTKSASKTTARKPRDANSKRASKGRGRGANNHPRHAVKVAAEVVRDTHRSAAHIEQFRGPQMPDTFRVLAESNVAQTRALYERSKSTLQAVLESWQKTFGAVSQGAIALNRTMLDSAERNINAGFDLTTNLASARNLADIMELQAVYWRKVLGELKGGQNLNHLSR